MSLGYCLNYIMEDKFDNDGLGIWPFYVLLLLQFLVFIIYRGMFGFIGMEIFFLLQVIYYNIPFVV